MINTITPVVNKFSLEQKLTSLFDINYNNIYIYIYILKIITYFEWFWFCSSEFSLLFSEDSLKEPIQKYINAAKVVLQYIDSVFLSTETGAEMLRTI